MSSYSFFLLKKASWLTLIRWLSWLNNLWYWFYTDTVLSSANSFCPRTDYCHSCVIKFLSTCVLNGVYFYTCLFMGISSKFAALFFICIYWVDLVCVLSIFYAEHERLQTRRSHLSCREPRAFPRKWPMVFSQPLIKNDYSAIFFALFCCLTLYAYLFCRISF